MNGAFNCTGGTGNFNSGLQDNGDVLTLIVTYKLGQLCASCERQAFSLIQIESLSSE